MRDSQHELQARNYAEKNPVKALLVREPKDWPWSSARFRDEPAAGFVTECKPAIGVGMALSRHPSLQTGRADFPHPAFQSVGALARGSGSCAVPKSVGQTFGIRQANCARLIPPPASPCGHSRWFVIPFSVLHTSTFLRPLAPRSLPASSLLRTL